jgi:hypothetical protein
VKTTLSRNKTKSREPADSIRDSELDSNINDESDLQSEKHDEQRISTSEGIITSSPLLKYRINFDFDESTMNDDSTLKREFPTSIEIEIFKEAGRFEKAEPSIKSTSRGIMINSRED